VRDEIEGLLKRFPDFRFLIKEVRKDQWDEIQYYIEQKFISKTLYKQAFHWSWERFKEPRYSVRFVGDVYRYYKYLIKDKVIWFLVEDYMDKIWLYEGQSEFIFNKLIPELVHLREYYLVSKKYQWIACENHHNVLCVYGREIIQNIKKFEQENFEEIIH